MNLALSNPENIPVIGQVLDEEGGVTSMTHRTFEESPLLCVSQGRVTSLRPHFIDCLESNLGPLWVRRVWELCHVLFPLTTPERDYSRGGVEGLYRPHRSEIERARLKEYGRIAVCLRVVTYEAVYSRASCPSGRRS